MFNKLTEDQVIFPINIKNSCKIYLDSGKEIDSETRQLCAKLTKMQIDAETDKLIANYGCQYNLALKKGAVVMCTVNLDVDLGICNGSQGIIKDIRNGVPYVDFGNGMILPIEMHFWQSEDYPTIAIGQIPLCLSWAMTIHKIQGASLKMAEIDIGFTIFEYGQTYVALSRIRSLDGLYLSAFNPHRIKANPLVKEFYAKIPVDHMPNNENPPVEIDTNIRIIRL
jgi:ATP-dependent DNA helicase PIF1